MRLGSTLEKSNEWARSMTLARIAGRNKRPRPAQMEVMPDGKVRVDTWLSVPPLPLVKTL